MVLDIITLVLLLAFVVWGMNRGLAKMALSAVSSLLSLVAGYMLFKPVSEMIARTELSQTLAKKMGESGLLGHLPGIMRDLPLASEAANEAYGAVAEGIYSSVADAAVKAISFAAVVVVVKLALMALSAAVGMASSLPVVHQANGLAGGALGFCVGAVFLLVLFTAIGALEAFGKLNVMGEWLSGSHIAALIYNNNPLLGVLIK